MTLEKSMESLLNKNEQFYNAFRKSYLSFFYVIENDFCWLNSIEIFINGYVRTFTIDYCAEKTKSCTMNITNAAIQYKLNYCSYIWEKTNILLTIWFKADFSFYWSFFHVLSVYEC